MNSIDRLRKLTKTLNYQIKKFVDSDHEIKILLQDFVNLDRKIKYEEKLAKKPVEKRILRNGMSVSELQ
jgi:predicted RNA-binding protein YlqC (UPF0109 family)